MQKNMSISISLLNKTTARNPHLSLCTLNNNKNWNRSIDPSSRTTHFASFVPQPLSRCIFFYLSLFVLVFSRQCVGVYGVFVPFLVITLCTLQNNPRVRCLSSTYRYEPLGLYRSYTLSKMPVAINTLSDESCSYILHTRIRSIPLSMLHSLYMCI